MKRGITEATCWSTTEASRILLLVAGVLGAGAIYFCIAAADSDDPGGRIVAIATLSVCAVLLVCNGWVRIACQPETLTVKSVLFGLRWKKIAWNDIENARVDDLRPLHWGGWGYRFAAGRSAFVLRAGPGVVFLLRNGREFWLSTRHADDLLAVFVGGQTRNESSETGAPWST